MIKSPYGALVAAVVVALMGCGPASPQSAGPPIPTPPADSPAWIEPDPQNVLVIDTNKGRVIAELAPAIAPLHVERIKTLTRQGFYDGLKFFRVIDGFMAQTGDPLNAGVGGSELPDLPAEFEFRRTAQTPFLRVQTSQESAQGITGLLGPVAVFTQPDGQMLVTNDRTSRAMALFCRGALGAARSTDPNSANSQFYLMRDDYPSLNGRYTVFGRILSGLEVVKSIKTGEPVREPMDAMTRVRILADIPADERPRVRVLDIRSQAFADYVAAWQAQAGPDSNICALNVPVQVEG